MRKLSLNFFSHIILFSLVIATHSCSCKRQNSEGKNVKKNNSKATDSSSSTPTPGAITVTPSAASLIGDEQRDFQITFQHIGDKPVSIGNYIVQISLKEEFRKGKPVTSPSTFSYKDKSNTLQTQQRLRKELSHFTDLTTFNKQNFIVDFSLQPTKSVEKLTFTISLFDGVSSSPPTEIIWNIHPKELIDQELLDELMKDYDNFSDKTKNQRQVYGANRLATYLERIKNGESLTFTNQHTAAEVAAVLGDSVIFDMLLKNIPDFNINAQNKDGNTPLHYVSNREITEFLINKGANLDIQAGSTTPFHTAIFNHARYSLKLKDKGSSYVEAITYMAGHGADVDNKRLLGQGKAVTLPIHTALLHDADLESTKKIIDLLSKAGNDINEKSLKGNTPLHTAVSTGVNEEIVRWLLNLPNINIDIPNNEAKTPLHLAVKGYRKNIVELLFNKGANKDLINSEGKTPLAEAQELQVQALAPGSPATDEQKVAIQAIVNLLT